jgi:hypothetical protein
MDMTEESDIPSGSESHKFDLEFSQKNRHYSYDLTQKLTYYVISIELVFCGYMLLNADKLINIQGASYLFATCGIAAFFGIVWRTFYNEAYHNATHEFRSNPYKVARYFQMSCYCVYVVLSIGTFVWVLIAGFNYLNSGNKPTNTVIPVQTKSLITPTPNNYQSQNNKPK